MPAWMASAAFSRCPVSARNWPSAPGQRRQEPAAADIGKQADAAFRHGEQGALGRNAVRAMHRKPDPAAHGHPVDQRHIGLGIVMDAPVQHVFAAEEVGVGMVGHPRRALRPGIVDRHQIAAGTEGPVAGPAHHHRMDRRVVGPGQESGLHGLDHLQGQRVERPRPVEGNEPDRPGRFEQDLVSHRWGDIQSCVRPDLTTGVGPRSAA